MKGEKEMIKEYTFKIYPTNLQEKIIIDTFYACRQLWNQMVKKATDAYDFSGKFVIPSKKSIIQNNRFFTSLDEKHIVIEKNALNNVRRELVNEYNKFINLPFSKQIQIAKGGRPRFLPKQIRSSTEYSRDIFIVTATSGCKVNNGLLNSVVRLGVLGAILGETIDDFNNEGELKEYSITYRNKMYYCTLKYET